MKKLSALVLGMSLLLAPLSSLAAFTMPSELYAAIQSAKPMTFAAELHGHANKYYLAMWVTGTSTLSQADPLAATKATIDISSPQGKLRAKVQLRMKEKMMYVFIDSVEGSLDNVAAHVGVTVASKQWFSIPLSDLLGSTTQAQDMSSMDQLLQLVSAAAKNGGTLYTLTLTRDAAREIVQGLNSGDLHDLGVDITNAMPPKVTFQIQMTLDAKNNVLLSSITMDIAQNGFGFSLKGWSAPAKSGFTVAVPKNSVSADDWMNTMGNMWSPDMSMSSDSSSESSWDDSSSSSDSSSWSDSSSSESMSSSNDCVMDLALLRQGGCGFTKPTHR